MAAFVESLKTYLEGLGHGPFTVGSLPDSPRDVIAIYDTGGLPGSLNEQEAGAPELITLQLRARNETQAGARDALLAIQSDLHRLTGANLGDWSIYVSVATDRPSILTREEKGSWSLVANYEITARQNV